MMQSTPAQKLWRTAQNELKTTLTQDIYENFFEKIACNGSEADTLLLLAPTEFTAMWIDENFAGLLREKLTLAAGRQVSYRLDFPQSENPAPEPPLPTKVHKNISPAHGDTDEFPPLPPAIKDSNTFENFIVAPENELAHAASLAVSEAPGNQYNPLFVYGATGLGKTHLLHAIAHAVLRRKPDSHILYVTCEAFTNDYINAVQERSLTAFRQRYRKVDILLIDDIHFLADKERTQEEFFHTFNELHNYRKQIVLTSDRTAREISRLEERLISRFSWGYTADIGAPSLETRNAILRSKAAMRGLELDTKIFDFLAEGIVRNVRNLEGAIQRLHGYQRNNNAVTIESAKRVLHDLLNEEGRNKITHETIQKRVADHYRIPLSEMTSKKKTAQIAFARQVAMYLCTQLTDASLSAIGNAFGGRDHGTVIHARKTVEGRMEVDLQVRREVEYLTGKITSNQA
ncbi:MAG: chromosomal replication initiator protein DnaA [Puniceicoccales bacterium]|jgi:chromosomal replication initiator protein|nr:chromosomal replication initiator protein DnaA [Puniceicoccales bacterium]